MLWWCDNKSDLINTIFEKSINLKEQRLWQWFRKNFANYMLDMMAVRSWSNTGMYAVYSTNLFLLEHWTGRYTLPSLVVLSSAKAVPCLALSVCLSLCCKLTHVPSPPLDTGHHARPTQLIHIPILDTIIPKQTIYNHQPVFPLLWVMLISQHY